MEITKGTVIDFVMRQRDPVYPSEIADAFKCELQEIIPIIKELVSEGKLLPVDG